MAAQDEPGVRPVLALAERLCLVVTRRRTVSQSASFIQFRVRTAMAILTVCHRNPSNSMKSISERI